MSEGRGGDTVSTAYSTGIHIVVRIHGHTYLYSIPCVLTVHTVPVLSRSCAKQRTVLKIKKKTAQMGGCSNELKAPILVQIS